ncbi:hypothetical protein FXF81_05250 [Salmonella enterica subsp. enterica serovar Nagoya]|nr:hypothetical protein [Salmonella enterica subsp. enterica serovar Nagoya]ECP0317539.1 hypothetical protein [Salmonella enterica subsp. enterica]
MIHTLKIQDFLSLNSDFEFSQLNIIKSDSHQGILLMKLLYALQLHISTPHEQDPAQSLYSNLSRMLHIEINYEIAVNGRRVTPNRVDLPKSNELEPVYLDSIGLLYVEHKELVSSHTLEYSCYSTCLSYIHNDLIQGKMVKGSLLRDDIHMPLSWLTNSDRMIADLSEIIKKGSLWNRGMLLWNDPHHSNVKTLARLIECISNLNQVFILTTNYELIYHIISPLKKEEYQLIDL